eukprot:5892056-Lingulodinium_polyedra.AAC.1
MCGEATRREAGQCIQKQEEATDFTKKRFTEEAATQGVFTEGASQDKFYAAPSSSRRESRRRGKVAIARVRKQHTCC